VFFFGVFFFDGFYGDSTGVVADQPSVEAAPSGEPHGYSLSVPLLRQVPGQRASPVRLLSPGILPLPEAFALVRGSGVSFSRWCSCGILSLTVYSGVWGIGEFAYLLGEKMDFV
jgi:hypothetical protein